MAWSVFFPVIFVIGGAAGILLVRSVGRWAKAVPCGTRSPSGLKAAIAVLVVTMGVLMAIPAIYLCLRLAAPDPGWDETYEGPAIERIGFNDDRQPGGSAAELSLNVVIPSGHAATFELVRTDSDGREKLVGLDWSVVASDRNPLKEPSDSAGWVTSG